MQQAVQNQISYDLERKIHALCYAYIAGQDVKQSLRLAIKNLADFYRVTIKVQTKSDFLEAAKEFAENKQGYTVTLPKLYNSI